MSGNPIKAVAKVFKKVAKSPIGQIVIGAAVSYFTAGIGSALLGSIAPSIASGTLLHSVLSSTITGALTGAVTGGLSGGGIGKGVMFGALGGAVMGGVSHSIGLGAPAPGSSSTTGPTAPSATASGAGPTAPGAPPPATSIPIVGPPPSSQVGVGTSGFSAQGGGTPYVPISAPAGSYQINTAMPNVPTLGGAVTTGSGGITAPSPAPSSGGLLSSAVNYLNANPGAASAVMGAASGASNALLDDSDEAYMDRTRTTAELERERLAKEQGNIDWVRASHGGPNRGLLTASNYAPPPASRAPNQSPQGWRFNPATGRIEYAPAAA